MVPKEVLTGPKSMRETGLTTADCEEAVDKIMTVLRQV
jgi:hypothetical protein